ncbi:MAG: hypothetical protein ACOCRX_02385 [Candidatus Woesearchaeota archaeon]
MPEIDIQYEEGENMFRKYKFLAILFILILVFLISDLSLAFGVNPLNIDIKGQPGDKVEFEIKLTPAGRQEVVNLKLHDAVQELSGALKFKESINDSVLNWINFDNERLIIPPDREVPIKGTVNIPYDAAGSYTVILMVEPEKKAGEVGIIMQVRYAIRIDIFVDRPGLRARGEVTEIGIKGDEDMNPVAYARIKNISDVNLSAASELTIRDENRRLLESISLKSPASGKSGRDYLVIYRDSEVQFEGKLNEPLPAGSYDLRLFLRYNNGQQLVRGEKIIVGDEYFHPERIKFIDFEPKIISENLRRGEAVAEAIAIRNKIDKDLIIQIGSKEIELEYPYSIFNDFSFELRGDSSMQLAGRREGRQVFIIKTPREIESGGYYGNIFIQVYNLENDLLESHKIPIEVIVGNIRERSIEVEKLNVLVENEKILFSITCLNKSSIHLKTDAVMSLKKDGEIVRTYNLYLHEGKEKILPLHSAVMFNEVSINNIEAGEYEAEIIVSENKDVLLEKKFDIIVPVEEEEEK